MSTRAPSTAAVAVVLHHDRDRGSSVLLVRRALLARDGHAMDFAGAWVVPGGVVEPTDHPPARALSSSLVTERRAAVRELREEVGIELGSEDLEYLWRIESVAPSGRRYEIHYFESWLPVGQHPVIDGAELSELQWLRPTKACAAANQGQLVTPPATRETLRRLAARDQGPAS
jgi:8-oxo-dGTP pyrophosphatase MutT (NUDIX family)